MQTTVCSDGDGQPVEGLGLGSEIRVSGLGLGFEGLGWVGWVQFKFRGFKAV